MKITLKKKILMISILPILILGAVAIIISLTNVRSSLISEIKDSLRGTAAATLAAYDQNSGEYMKTENGDVWKGGYNISKSESLVDNIKERSGMDVTFFYGAERIMTSATDKNGERILGSPAGDIIVKKVLNGGEEYFSESVLLDDTLQYGYYIPVYQKGGSAAPVGMIFVGTDKEAKDSAINKIILMIVLAVLIVMALCVLVAVIFSVSITSPLKKSIGAVQSVAMGDLDVKIDNKFYERHDEIGDLSKAIQTLQTELKKILRNIAQSTNELTAASEHLETTARETNVTMRQVENAVNGITESTAEQAQNTMNVSQNIMLMGSQIGETSEEISLLNENADTMKRSSEQASVTLRQLLQINAEVEKSIDTITRQTNQTNESAQKIREATELISSIAEETNLLSLNASIEAARAGENGRGFAVVASQIQKLAEQSNDSSHTIEEITNTLINDSDEAVATMKHVQKIIDDQSRNMSDTEKIVSEVMNGIGTSLKSIEQIDKSTVILEESRNKIVRTVEDLSNIAQKNASSTEETCVQTVEVADTFSKIEDSALKLRTIADELSETMNHFRLET